MMGTPNELPAKEVRHDLLLGIHASTVLADPPGPLPRASAICPPAVENLASLFDPLRDAPLGISVRKRRSALDFELSQIPDKWRLPLILCYLEGRTQDDAASQLGWSPKTLNRRLDEARAALAKGLATAEAKLPKLENGDLGSATWSDWIIAHALMSEAKALIEGASAPVVEPSPLK